MPSALARSKSSDLPLWWEMSMTDEPVGAGGEGAVECEFVHSLFQTKGCDVGKLFRLPGTF
jgi:hypothetical protein